MSAESTPPLLDHKQFLTVVYASFRQRFVAAWIDLFVLLPLLASLIWLSSFSPTTALICAVPHWLIYWYYSYHFHGKTGQTIGKRKMGIRVVNLDGTRINRSVSFRRSVVDLFFAVVAMVGSIWGITQLNATEYSAASWFDQQRMIDMAQPALTAWISTLSLFWVWSEVITMLFNQKKRALHDFIGGTVVVSEK